MAVGAERRAARDLVAHLPEGGKNRTSIRLPSTSTGVPCVPMTLPPMMRSTVLRCWNRQRIVALVPGHHLLGELIEIVELVPRS